MNRITLTVHLDLPDGVIPDVAYSTTQTPVPSPAAAAPPPVAASGALVVDGPRGECPKHRRSLKAGKFGPYCSAKDDSTDNGYCTLTPGDIWNGVRVVAP